MSQSTITEIRRKLPILTKKDEDPAQNAVLELPIDDIIPNRSQPRSCFNQNAILRLADSIRRYGILQPLTVRKLMLPKKGRKGLPSLPFLHMSDKVQLSDTPDKEITIMYELIAGERRLRAARYAGLTTVPCLIVNTDDSTSAELAIIENLLREDLNMFEQAEAFRKLIDEFMLTQDEVARRVSLSQSAVANKLRILRLSPEERQAILSGGLTERHARALLKLHDISLRKHALQQITQRKLNVSATESYIDGLLDEMGRYQHCRQVSASPAFTEEASNSAGLPSNPQNSPNDPLSTVGKDAEKSTAASQMVKQAKKQPILKGAIKDIRLFYNSIRNATAILEQAGAITTVEQAQDEQGITVTIRVENGTRVFPSDVSRET